MSLCCGLQAGPPDGGGGADEQAEGHDSGECCRSGRVSRAFGSARACSRPSTNTGDRRLGGHQARPERLGAHSDHRSYRKEAKRPRAGKPLSSLTVEDANVFKWLERCATTMNDEDAKQLRKASTHWFGIPTERMRSTGGLAKAAGTGAGGFEQPRACADRDNVAI